MKKPNKIREEIDGLLYAGLGAMNMLGVMDGKTTEGAIRIRDKVVKDINALLDKLIKP